MFELARFFVDLALLRRAPQDLPASAFLLRMLLVVNFAINLPLALSIFKTPLDAMLATLLELTVTGALLFAGLQVRGTAQRWRQSFASLLGLGALAGLATAGYRLLAPLLGVPELAALLDIVVFIWSMLAMAHVIRHAFDTPLPFAILIVFAYTMFLLGLIAQWFAPELVAQPPAS
jgi:hypothetical protein